jgi:hypothetical protein
VPSCVGAVASSIPGAPPALAALKSDQSGSLSPISSRNFPQPTSTGAGVLALAGALLVSVSLLLRRLTRAS